MRYIIFLLAALLPISANAEWSGHYSTEYVMGDGDSRVSARQIAMEKLKTKAADDAGSYVQGTSTLADGNLTENIRILTASLVKVRNQKEVLTVNGSGQSVMQIDADVTVDDSELTRRIAVLQQDNEKTALLAQLRQDNALLRSQLDDIRVKLAKEADPDKAIKLLAMQDETLRHLAQNGNTVSQTFASGTIRQMADINAAEMQVAKTWLDGAFFAPIMQSPVTAKIVSIQADGDGYVAQVKVNWEIQDLSKNLSRYLNVRNEGGYLLAEEFTNHNGPSKLTEQVYRYLTTQGVGLELSIGSRKVVLPVFYADASFMDACSNYSQAQAGGAKRICLVTSAKNAPVSDWLLWKYGNPVRIKISKADAEMATSITARFIR